MSLRASFYCFFTFGSTPPILSNIQRTGQNICLCKKSFIGVVVNPDDVNNLTEKKFFSPYPQANALSNHRTVAWVPECLKGVKDEVKSTRRAPRLLYWHTFDGDTLQVFWRKTLPLNYDQLTERHWKGSWLIWFWTNMITWSGECWEISDVWTREQTFGETFLQESRTDLAVHARSTLSSNIHALNVLQKVTIFRCDSSS